MASRSTRGGARIIALAVTWLAVAAQPASALTISEFRNAGEGGSTAIADTDEFVEIHNESAQALTVRTADGSSGFAVAGTDGAVRFVIPNGTVIPPGGHYLGVGPGYTDATYAAPDATYANQIPHNTGVALFRTADPSRFSSSTRIDAAGFTTDPELFREGAGILPFNNQTSVKGALVRDLFAGTPKDTDGNAADFRWADTNGTSRGSGHQRLGAPAPQNLGGPRLGLPAFAGSLLDPAVDATQPPNRVRGFASDPANNSVFGTLTLRRTLTNNSAFPIASLRFRIADVTTFPSPSGVADLRPRTIASSNVTVNAVVRNVRGTTVEQPPNQPNGGGINTGLSVPTVTPATPIAPGASIDVQFLFGIQQTGDFRFCVYTETLPAGAGGLIQVTGDTDNAVDVVPGKCSEPVLPGAAAAASPDRMSFGSREVGTGSETQTVTVTNSGAETMQIVAVAPSGADPGDFPVRADGCTGAVVAQGATCTLGLAFAPSGAGPRSAVLRLFDRSGGTFEVPLDGTGVAPSGPGPGGPLPVPDSAGPVFAGSLRFGSPTFAAAARGASLVPARRRAPIGTTLTFTLDEAATVRFTVEKRAAGRRVGRRCVKPTPSNRSRRRCTRFVLQKGSFSSPAVSGLNRLRFTGRLRNRKLSVARYRLVAVATDAAGNKSSAKRATFRIVRR